jgi:hypothetical protein
VGVHRNLVHLVVLIMAIRRRITHLIPLVKDEDQGTYPTPLLVVLFSSHFFPLFSSRSFCVIHFRRSCGYLHIQYEMHRYTSMTGVVPASQRHQQVGERSGNTFNAASGPAPTLIHFHM